MIFCFISSTALLPEIVKRFVNRKFQKAGIKKTLFNILLPKSLHICKNLRTFARDFEHLHKYIT